MTNALSPDQPVTAAEAALRLGLSQKAIRGRLLRGTLRGERRPEGWVVWLPTERPATGAPSGPQPALPRASASAREIARLEATIAVLTVELKARRREVAELIVLLRQQRLPMR